jgi:hypothetical protein
LVLSVVAFGLVCCCIVCCGVAFSVVKEVMGWRYFADGASMSFFEKKKPYPCSLQSVFLGGYGVKKSYHELRYDFVFCLTRL